MLIGKMEIIKENNAHYGPRESALPLTTNRNRKVFVSILQCRVLSGSLLQTEKLLNIFELGFEFE